MEKKEFHCEECKKDFENKQQLNGHMLSHKKAAKAKERKKELRKKRIPLGKRRLKLAFHAPEGTVGRIVNDNWHKNPNRISDAKRGGYEFVTEDEEGNICVESDNEGIGTRISVAVGTNDDGSVITGYLMAIDEDLHEEDRKEYLREVDKTDEAIRSGKLNTQLGKAGYVPKEGITMEDVR